MREFGVISILICFFVTSVQAQRRLSLPFAAQYDEKAAVLIGMQYSYSLQSYQLGLANHWQNRPIDYPSDDVAYLGDLKSISSPYKSTFSVGIPIDIRANDNVYFNFSPAFMFMNGSAVRYAPLDNSLTAIDRKQRQSLSSNTGSNFNAFEFPFALKFRSDEKFVGKYKQGRYRAYVLGGARVTRWVNINKEYNDLLKLKRTNQVYPDNIIIKPQYFSWEAGVGVDIFFEHFKVSPELKFSQSFGNVLDKNHELAIDNKFMAPLEKSHIRNIYLSLTFQ